MFPIIVFLESLDCPESDTVTMADGAFIYVFFYLLAYLLWLELDGIDYLVAIATVKCHITTFRIEGTLTFFAK